VLALALLLAGTGSVVVELTEAVLDRLVPSGVLALTVALDRHADAAAGRDRPDVGRAGPDGVGVQLGPVQNLAPVSSAGRLSLTRTDWASDGPPFVTTIV
jgi:hypothetical protein